MSEYRFFNASRDLAHGQGGGATGGMHQQQLAPHDGVLDRLVGRHIPHVQQLDALPVLARQKAVEHLLQLANTQVRLKIEQNYQVVPLRLIGGQVFISGNAANLVTPAPLPTVAQTTGL